jgi:hypothetical protein
MKHCNESFEIWKLMEVINERLTLDQDNFDMIFQHIKFLEEIRTFMDGCVDQSALDRFLQEIDRQVELQRRPFLHPLNEKTPIGSFFHRAGPDLCEKIFDFLPNPEIPKPKLG